MSLPSITRIKASEWLLVSDKRLKRVVMVLAGLVFLDLLVYFVLVAPSGALLSAHEATYSQLRKQQAAAILFKKQRPLFAGIMAGIPAQKDMPILVKEYVQAAKRLNLTVAAVNYDMPKRGSGELAMLAFSFPAEGRYPDIKRLIYDVETSDRLIGIQDLKLETEKGRVKLNMKLMTYVKEQ